MLALLSCLVMARPLVMAHYMPWYQSKPFSGQWGWHWTMAQYDPDRRGADGRQELASQFRPVIGAYESSDPDVLECHTLQMKIAGIDGVFIDWYGTQDMYDYARNNLNTGKLIGACSLVGLKFSVVIEDAIVPGLVKAGKCSADEYGVSALRWLNSHWFGLPGFLRWNGKPVVLMFGPQYYKDADLDAIFGHDTSFFSLLGRRGRAVGAFGWPGPQVGNERSWSELGSFYERAKGWPAAIAVAYPRFEDIYRQAGVHQSWGEIVDSDGATFRKTLSMAERSGAPFIQIATWNDWGEGTQTEPSVEYGYRDLEVLQEHRRAADPDFPYRAADLRLPAKLYRLRKSGASRAKLDRAVKAILAGRCSQASALLNGP